MPDLKPDNVWDILRLCDVYDLSQKDIQKIILWLEKMHDLLDNK